ncbi:MAG: ParA family protein [Gammaproteobacteria bacterium]|nr:ParA family protein [Gammaproteobacteria bacterium]
MIYAVWSNKGGVGKTYLSFTLATELSQKYPDRKVVLIDMCPQANLSEIVLGGNGCGAIQLNPLIKNRMTIGGYFYDRLNKSQFVKTGAIDNLGELIYDMSGSHLTNFHSQVKQYNLSLPSIFAVVLNRTTQYDKKASKAYGAMFDAIKERVNDLVTNLP